MTSIHDRRLGHHRGLIRQASHQLPGPLRIRCITVSLLPANPIPPLHSAPGDSNVANRAGPLPGWGRRGPRRRHLDTDEPMGISNRGLFGRGSPGWTRLAVTAWAGALAACSHGAPGAPILPALPPGVRAFVAEVRYDVTGATVDEIQASLRRSATALPQGATGYHRWDIKWTYSYARAEVYCELSDIAIELNSTITLPEWHRPEEADSALVAAWNQYLVDLRSHENGHRVLAYRTASEIRRALDRLRVEDCAFIVNEARKVGEGILARHGQDGAEFDADPANRVTWPPRSR